MIGLATKRKDDQCTLCARKFARINDIHDGQGYNLIRKEHLGGLGLDQLSTKLYT